MISVFDMITRLLMMFMVVTEECYMFYKICRHVFSCPVHESDNNNISVFHFHPILTKGMFHCLHVYAVWMPRPECVICFFNMHCVQAFMWPSVFFKTVKRCGHVSAHSLTHSWSWALLQKLPIVQLLKNFPAFCGTRRFITMFTRALHGPCPEPDQSNPYHPILSL
jgi:hypothetical protein